MDKELSRQLFHMLVGAVAIGLLFQFGRGFMIGSTFFIIVIGLLLMNARLVGIRVPLVDWFERTFEREGARLPGWGSACYATGALFAFTFLTSVEGIAAVLVILGLGDGISTIIGRMGKMKLPHNSNKTVAGSLAFFVVAMANIMFIGPLALPLAFVATVAESMPKVEDNILIPIVCTVFLLLF